MPPASRPSSPLFELIKMRLREYVREKGILFWVFAFPILMAIGLGLAFRSRPPDAVRVSVVGDEHAALASALLNADGVEAERQQLEEARRDLARAKADVVVDLRGPAPRYIYDATQERGPRAKLVVDDLLQRAAGREDALQASEETESPPGSRYIDFLLPGLIGLNLMGTSMWGVGYNLVVARKRRLLRRFAVTPMRRSQFLLSYFFSRSLFLVVEIAVLVAFGALVFDTELQGSYLGFALIGFFGAASFAGISLLIGARVENTESANGWMNLVQLPMWVLSGAFFSYERFPEWLHPAIRALPLTALVDALRAVFNDAASLWAVAPQLLVLGLWGGLGFAVALRAFRWQ